MHGRGVGLARRAEGDVNAQIIEARALRKSFPSRARAFGGASHELVAVDGVSFAIGEGEILGLAGESGSGKSTTGMTVLNLHKPSGGEIHFAGLGRIDGADKKTMLAFRRQAQIVFQNPFESLNPRRTVEASVHETIAIHFPGDRESQRARVIRALERAGLSPVETYLNRYPHQLSGGQLQRVAIARAISIEPRFLVADEPVSMLDVSIRAGILNLFRFFAREMRMAILYISHDLSTMRHICSRIAVMYLGRIVEEGPAEAILSAPRHPYTQALIAAVPVMGGRGKRPRVVLSGVPPDAANLPKGCRFHPRCPKAIARCRESDPELRRIAEGHHAACHLYE
jgi:oligopeptide/dipeptide ABC transporter ATP-binding protein